MLLIHPKYEQQLLEKSVASPPRIHVPPIQPVIGNIPVHPRECQGGRPRYRESMLEFAKRSGCDTIITLSCHRDVSYDALKSFIEKVVHKAQNKHAKRRRIYVNMTFYVERTPSNTHCHGLISFPSAELREKFWKTFPLTESRKQRVLTDTLNNTKNINQNKSPYWTNICETGTYDLQVMNDRDAAISYAQKENDRAVDYDKVMYSADFVTSAEKPNKKPRYPKIKK